MFGSRSWQGTMKSCWVCWCVFVVVVVVSSNLSTRGNVDHRSSKMASINYSRNSNNMWMAGSS